MGLTSSEDLKSRPRPNEKQYWLGKKKMDLFTSRLEKSLSSKKVFI